LGGGKRVVVDHGGQLPQQVRVMKKSS